MSVVDDEAAENDMERSSTTRRTAKPARKPVAATLHISKVTPRAIAYAATQV